MMAAYTLCHWPCIKKSLSIRLPVVEEDKGNTYSRVHGLGLG